MNNQFIRKIGFKEMTDLISSAETELLISLPNIHDELAETIKSYKNKIKDIRIIVDNNERNYRKGYGDIEAIEKLKNIGVDVFNLESNFVSFIICDNTGYYLFPQSRVFFGDDDIETNAVVIDPISVVKLKNYFSGNSSGANKEDIRNQFLDSYQLSKDFMEKALNEINTEEPLKIKELHIDEIKDVKSKLDINPPLHPDIERKIETYTSKVQFVELNFEGANLHSMDIKIPPNALPFKDENIKNKLKTKMKLFSNMNDKAKFKLFVELKDRVDKARTDYLTPLTSRKDKSVIKIEDKESIEKEIKEINEEIPKVNAAIKSFIQEEILNSKKQIQDELHDFLINNPPESLNDYKGKLFKESVEYEVGKIINRIIFPNPDKILSKVSIKIHFYDLTFEDFKDKNLTDEFKKKKIMKADDISSIVSIRDAFEAKK